MFVSTELAPLKLRQFLVHVNDADEFFGLACQRFEHFLDMIWNAEIATRSVLSKSTLRNGHMVSRGSCSADSSAGCRKLRA